MTDNACYKALLYIMNNASKEQLTKCEHFIQKRLGHCEKREPMTITELFDVLFGEVIKK